MKIFYKPFSRHVPECIAEIERACAFMEQHYQECIRLEQICRCAALSKSALLQAFTQMKGVTPYSYLVPVITVTASFLILQEPITWLSGTGTALTFVSLFLSGRKAAKLKVGN